MDDWKEKYIPLEEHNLPPISEHAREHGLNPKNMAELENADGYGKVEGVCGDSMEFWLKFDESHKVTDIGFMTDGCYSSVACGSACTCIAKGRTIEQLMELSPADVLRELDDIPDRHCSILAMSTLFRALGDYLNKKGML